MKFKQTAGIDLKGVATDNITGQPIEDGKISLVIKKDAEMAFLTDTTGKTGEFTFPGLVFNDTAKVLVQAKNEKGRSCGTGSQKRGIVGQYSGFSLGESGRARH